MIRQACRGRFLTVSAGLLALILLSAPGCKKKPEIVVPEVEESLIEQTSGPGEDTQEETSTVEPEELGTSPTDLPDEDTVEKPEEPKAPAVETPPQTKPEPAPPPVSPNEPPPAEEETAKPRLLADSDTPGKAELREKLAAAGRLLERLDQRSLTKEQADLVVAGEAFVHQAQDAFDLDELDRAAILIEKALALLRDVEQSSRP